MNSKLVGVRLNKRSTLLYKHYDRNQYTNGGELDDKVEQPNDGGD